MSSNLLQEGFRYKLRQRLNHFRRRSDNLGPDTNVIPARLDHV